VYSLFLLFVTQSAYAVPGTEESPHLENSSDFDRLRRGINNAHGL